MYHPQKRKLHLDDAESAARHVRGRLSHVPPSSAILAAALPFRPRPSVVEPEPDVPSDAATAGSSEVEPAEDGSGDDDDEDLTGNERDRIRSLNRIRQLTGLEPEDVLYKRFQPGYKAEDIGWVCKEPGAWGTKHLSLLARIFGYVTPQELNKWLDTRVKAKREYAARGRSRQVTVVHRLDLIIYLQQCKDKTRRDQNTL